MRLACNIDDVLGDTNTLSYFVQYMHSIGTRTYGFFTQPLVNNGSAFLSGGTVDSMWTYPLGVHDA